MDLMLLRDEKGRYLINTPSDLRHVKWGLENDCHCELCEKARSLDYKTFKEAGSECPLCHSKEVEHRRCGDGAAILKEHCEYYCKSCKTWLIFRRDHA